MDFQKSGSFKSYKRRQKRPANGRHCISIVREEKIIKSIYVFNISTGRSDADHSHHVQSAEW